MHEPTANIDPKYTGNPDEKYPEHWQGIELFRKCFTLDNIFQYASDEELEAIVHSIHNRILGELIVLGRIKIYNNQIPQIPLLMTDKELHEVAKGLRKPQ